jgi:uncharacterized protein DUF6525
MSGNAGRGYSNAASTAKDESQWCAFEKLPRSVRDALNTAHYPWAPYPIWRRWEKGEWKTAQALVHNIKAWDADMDRRQRKAADKAAKQRTAKKLRKACAKPTVVNAEAKRFRVRL